MQELEVTWERTIKVYWSLFWRAVLITLVGTILLEIIFDVFEGDERVLPWITWALSFGAALYGTKKALEVHYSEFRVCLVARETDDVAPPDNST